MVPRTMARKAKSLCIFRGAFIILEPVRMASSTQRYVIMPSGFIRLLIIMHLAFTFHTQNDCRRYNEHKFWLTLIN